jgi:hypothetical protein
LIVKSENGDMREDVVVGLVSFGTGCANLDYPGVYTRVAGFSEFIVVDGLCEMSQYAPLDESICATYRDDPAISDGATGGNEFDTVGFTPVDVGVDYGDATLSDALQDPPPPPFWADDEGTPPLPPPSLNEEDDSDKPPPPFKDDRNAIDEKDKDEKDEKDKDDKDDKDRNDKDAKDEKKDDKDDTSSRNGNGNNNGGSMGNNNNMGMGRNNKGMGSSMGIRRAQLQLRSGSEDRMGISSRLRGDTF